MGLMGLTLPPGFVRGSLLPALAPNVNHNGIIQYGRYTWGYCTLTRRLLSNKSVWQISALLDLPRSTVRAVAVK